MSKKQLNKPNDLEQTELDQIVDGLTRLHIEILEAYENNDPIDAPVVMQEIENYSLRLRKLKEFRKVAPGIFVTGRAVKY